MFSVFLLSAKVKNPERQLLSLQIILKDSLSLEPVNNALVSCSTVKQSAISDNEGKSSIKLHTGTHDIIVRHMSYGYKLFPVEITHDTIITLFIPPVLHSQAEVGISIRQDRPISGMSEGNLKLNINSLQKLPQFLGSNDPLKIIQLTPGVQTAGDGNSGIFIRGGETGHNLVLFNEAPVYQPSHLLGFFSIFNTGHVSQLSLHKNNLPSSYGGRLSSILNITTSDSIPEQATVSGNIGLLSSQATLSIPIKQKYAVLISARKTYMDLILNPLLTKLGAMPDDEGSFYYDFQDYNLSFTGRPTDRDRIAFHGYWGKDIFKLHQDEYRLDGKMEWSNMASSAVWERTGVKLKQMRHILFSGKYKNSLRNSQSGFDIEIPSDILTCGYKNDFSFSAGPVHFLTGAEYNFYYLSPQRPDININTSVTNDYQRYRSHSIAAFAHTDWKVSSRLNINLGLRYTYYIQTGPYNDILYDDNNLVINTVSFKRNEKVWDTHFPEPRAEVKYTINDNNIIRGSYNRLSQFINLISVSTVGLPTDFWVPASKNIPSQYSHNYSLGFYHIFHNAGLEFSAEGYYRKLYRQMEIKGNIFDLGSQKFILENSISYGKGENYGAEVMLKKNTGKITGWISYTLGWSFRQFPDINNGKKFPAKHDRRHDLSTAVIYNPTHKWDLSAVYVYATGNAFTMPVGFHVMSGLIVKEYGPYNGFRLPDYHRLDLSVSYWLVKKRNKESGFNLSLYNCYNKVNPLYFYIGIRESDLSDNHLKFRRRQFSLYKIVPSVSWMFKF